MNLQISTVNKKNDSIINSINFKSKLHSKNEIINEVENISKRISLKGFIYNTYILNVEDSIYKCSFTLNNRIDSIKIHFNNKLLKKDVVKKLSESFNDSTFTISTKEVENTLNSIINHLENDGYSFIDAQLTNLKFIRNTFNADLLIKPTQKRYVDKVIIKGYEKFPKKYTTQHLGLKPSTEFKLKHLETLNEKLTTIPFINVLKKPEVLFSTDSTFLYLYIKKINTNNFDGIISLSNNEDNNKLQISGYINFTLNNILNNGETFNFEYKNYDNSKILNLNTNFPYVFGSKFGTDANITIIKQDSSYVSTSAELKLNYNINSKNLISISYNNTKSDIVQSSTTNNYNNFSTNLIGFIYTYNPFFSISKQISHNLNFEISFLTGKREISNVKNNQNKIETSLSYRKKINNSSYIFLKNTFNYINSKNILDNELYQIGGVNSIRGFSELSISTSQFNVTNLEYQYLLNDKLTLFTITDFSVIKNENTLKNSNLYGIGLGLNVTSSSNILSLSYALGKTDKTPFNIKKGMVHFKISYPF